MQNKSKGSKASNTNTTPTCNQFPWFNALWVGQIINKVQNKQTNTHPKRINTLENDRQNPPTPPLSLPEFPTFSVNPTPPRIYTYIHLYVYVGIDAHTLYFVIRVKQVGD